MREEMKRLNDVFPGWLTGSGIFAAMQAFDVPWADLTIESQLDLEYHGNISGEKLVSPLVNKLISGDTLTEAQKDQLAEVIVKVCGTNWIKQWETLSAQYNPIENYSMTEEMSNDETTTVYGKTRTRTDNLSHTKTGTETEAPDITETQTPELTNETANTVHGFNSAEGVPTGEQTQKATGTNTMKQTGTDTRTYNTTDADTGTQTDNDGGTDKQTRNYKLTRSGNIGVTTSQQMLTSERNLWMWYYFYEVVFPDIDRVLTIPIY